MLLTNGTRSFHGFSKMDDGDWEGAATRYVTANDIIIEFLVFIWSLWNACMARTVWAKPKIKFYLQTIDWLSGWHPSNAVQCTPNCRSQPPSSACQNHISNVFHAWTKNYSQPISNIISLIRKTSILRKKLRKKHKHKQKQNKWKEKMLMRPNDEIHGHGSHRLFSSSWQRLRRVISGRSRVLCEWATHSGWKDGTEQPCCTVDQARRTGAGRWGNLIRQWLVDLTRKSYSEPFQLRQKNKQKTKMEHHSSM